MDETAGRSVAVPLGALALGGITALVVGVFGAFHEPSIERTSTLGFTSVLEMKVTLTAVVGVLVIGQVLGALWLYGLLGVRAPRWLGPAHRVSGVVTLALSVIVAYHCLWSLGLQTGQNVTTRVVVHSLVGCAVFGALVIKLFAVHSRRSPGWFLPLAGALLFTLLVAVVWTSTVWYVRELGWPSAGY